MRRTDERAGIFKNGLVLAENEGECAREVPTGNLATAIVAANVPGHGIPDMDGLIRPR